MHPRATHHPRWSLLVAAMLAATLAPMPARAHGPLHAEIDALTTEIAQHPDDCALWMERAELRRLDGSFEQAAADLDRASALAPSLTRLGLLRGRLALDRGDLVRARGELDRYVALEPGDARGFELRAHVREAEHDAAAAADDLGRAIALSHPAPPDWVLARARLRVASGAPDVALRELDSVLAAGAPVIGLERAALDLEQRLGRTDAALARIERMAPQLGPPHQVHVERAAVLEQAGRTLEACAELSEALSLLESEPAQARARPAHQALETGLRARLAALQPREASR